MALARWCALNTISFIWSEGVKSDVTMTPRSRHELNGSVKEPNEFHNYETENVTRKASDVAEYIELFCSSPEIVVHDAFNVIL